ncbi:MAG: iron-sulfur cluster assembly accessory protein [Verrucomicrobiota bacterium]
MAEEVNYKVGSEKLVKLTENASKRMRSLLDKHAKEGGALRVAVVGGGCSGLSYKMEVCDGPKEKDFLIQSLDVPIVVDPKSALFVSGSEIDFSDDLQSGGFKVKNPNAVSHCSCGESFSA